MAITEPRLPPLEWIRVFEAAARTGSFTSAAAEAGLTQAAVSLRIRNLEQHIGAQLFERSARGVALTVEGEAWLPHVQNALSALGQSTHELFGMPRRKLSIAASASVIGLWIIPRLAQLTRRLPSVQISLATVSVQPDYPRIDADFELRYGNGNWPDCQATPLFAEEMSPVAAPSLKKSENRDWTTLPGITVAGPRPGWREWAQETGAGTPGFPGVRFDTFVQARHAAEAGAGVLLASLPLCQDAIESGALIRLSEVTIRPGNSYWLTSPRHTRGREWEILAESFSADGD